MSKTYTTVQGDMWDSIAHTQLGDVKYTDALINANLKYHETYIFESGIALVIPDIITANSTDALPPWKKVSG